LGLGINPFGPKNLPTFGVIVDNNDGVQMTFVG
jgi:hypothetical protein